jgi:hypothetical protein
MWWVTGSNLGKGRVFSLHLSSPLPSHSPIQTAYCSTELSSPKVKQYDMKRKSIDIFLEQMHG